MVPELTSHTTTRPSLSPDASLHQIRYNMSYVGFSRCCYTDLGTLLCLFSYASPSHVLYSVQMLVYNCNGAHACCLGRCLIHCNSWIRYANDLQYAERHTGHLATKHNMVDAARSQEHIDILVREATMQCLSDFSAVDWLIRHTVSHVIEFRIPPSSRALCEQNIQINDNAQHV